LGGGVCLNNSGISGWPIVFPTHLILACSVCIAEALVWIHNSRSLILMLWMSSCFINLKQKVNSQSDNIKIRSCLYKLRSIWYSYCVLIETSLITQLNSG